MTSFFEIITISQSLLGKSGIPKPVWAVGFALEQTLRDATLAVFSFANFKRLQHIPIMPNC
ncbi:MAG: hypothetical protein LBH59_11800 [Planctomycetaceae bacterium]|nr:hypothetical protein [Planctomycetaceae bacterium]